MMEPIDGVSAIVVVLIASFAIDRIVTGLLFLLSFIKPWSRAFPDPATTKDTLERVSAVKKQKLIYFVFAGILSGLIVYFGQVKIFDALGFEGKDEYDILDNIITGLILMGGSDRVAAVLKTPGAPGIDKSAPHPIEITGRLTLEEEGGRKLW